MARNKIMECQLIAGLRYSLLGDKDLADELECAFAENNLSEDNVHYMLRLASASALLRLRVSRVLIILSTIFLLNIFLIPSEILHPAIILLDMPVVIASSWLLVRSCAYILSTKIKNEEMAWAFNDFQWLTLNYLEGIASKENFN